MVWLRNLMVIETLLYVVIPLSAQAQSYTHTEIVKPLEQETPPAPPLTGSYPTDSKDLASTVFFTHAVSKTSTVTSSAAKKPTKVKKIKSFKKVKVLVIGPKKKSKKARGFNVSATTESSKALFYLTTSGLMKEVTYVDQAGKSITITSQPAVVYDASDSYLFIGYGTDGANINEGYLVSKNDGKMFPLEKVGYPAKTSGDFKNGAVIRSDSFGNLYYASCNWVKGLCSPRIIKLNTLKPTKLSAIQLTPSDESVEAFAIDPAGNLLYSGKVNDSTDYVFRLRKFTGGFENIPGGLVLPMFWLGNDSAFYYVDPVAYKIYKMVVNEAGMSTRTDYASVTDRTAPSCCSWGTFIFSFADRTVMVDTLDKKIIEVNNVLGIPREITTLNLASVTSGSQTPSHYYVAGTDSNGFGTLLKVDPATDATTSLTDPGTYSFYSVAVGEDETVTFNALRMSDGSKVISSISPAGTETVTSRSNFVAVDIDPIN